MVCGVSLIAHHKNLIICNKPVFMKTGSFADSPNLSPYISYNSIYKACLIAWHLHSYLL